MQTTLSPSTSSKPKGETNRNQRVKIAADTLAAIQHGSYSLNDVTYPLAAAVQTMIDGTVYEAPTSATMANWKSAPAPSATAVEKTTIEMRLASTLISLRALCAIPDASVGVLNFASAHKPGGGFLSGAQAQEESLARSSTIYNSFMSEKGHLFYKGGEKKVPGYYSHAMLWTPGVTFFRNDRGDLVEPCTASLVTSAAVNAGAVKSARKQLSQEQLTEADARIRSTMHERMGRVLYLFEQRGSTHLVLGSFGTGVFRNDIGTVAELWAELLGPGTRFEKSFTHIDFAIIDEKTLDTFKAAFARRLSELVVTT